MSWETYKGRRFYVRRCRVGKKIVGHYIGGGEKGEQAAAEDLQRRQERADQKRARDAEAARVRQTDQMVVEFAALTDLLARGELLFSGYHRPKGGPWRRRKAEQGGTLKNREADATVQPGYPDMKPNRGSELPVMNGSAHLDNNARL